MAIAEWTPLSLADLDDIFLHIAIDEKRPVVARQVDESIIKQADEYATHFDSGHVLGTDRSDIRKGLRTVSFKRWVILFRPVAKSIRVLAVVDGSRDYDTLFLERSSD